MWTANLVSESVPSVCLTRPAMGALAEVHLHGDELPQLHAAGSTALDEISRLSERWSRFSPMSEICRVNREAAHGWVRVDRELFAVLVACEHWRQTTAGAFDIAGRPGMISPAESPVILDHSRSAIRFASPEIRLDLGGYGKGAALDAASQVLHAVGVEHALLQIGTSSIVALGDSPQGTGWPIALRHPNRAAEIVQQLTLQNAALSTSATFHPGQTTSDLLDPRTGQPLTTQRSVTICAPTAAEAEAWSTACVVVGPEVAEQWLAAQKSAICVFQYGGIT